MHQQLHVRARLHTTAENLKVPLAPNGSRQTNKSDVFTLLNKNIYVFKLPMGEKKQPLLPLLSSPRLSAQINRVAFLRRRRIILPWLFSSGAAGKKGSENLLAAADSLLIQERRRVTDRPVSALSHPIARTMYHSVRGRRPQNRL